MCDERDRLLKAFNNATICFSEAVTRLCEDAEKASQEEYRRLYCTAQQARDTAEEAREALGSHDGEHRC
jgi:hypothetical protein